MTDTHGRSRLCGFIRFDRAQAAFGAIAKLNLYLPAGAYRPIKVRIAAKQADHWKAKGVGPYSREKAMLLRKCKNVRKWAHPPHQAYHFNEFIPSGKYGSTTSVSMLPANSESEISSPHNIEANGAPTSPEEKNEGSYFYARHANIMTSNEAKTGLFLCNLPTVFDEDHIKHFCGEYGTILQVRLQKSKDHSSLGMGFITFATAKEAEAAQAALNNCVIFNKTLSARLVD